MKKLIQLVLLFALTTASSATTFYVRTDGGTRYSTAGPGPQGGTSTGNTTGQCDGTHDAPYPGSGVNQPCAYNDARWLYDDQHTYGFYNWAMVGGDTAILDNGQQWQIGFDSPTTSNWCSGQGGAPSCAMPPPPAGTPSVPTRIMGRNYAACSRTVIEYNGVTGKPFSMQEPDPAKTTQIYGDYGLDTVTNLNGTHDVVFACLEDTSHNSTHCITHGTMVGGGQPPETPACPNSPPYAHNANRAFLNDFNTYDITLQDMNIHGFSAEGMRGEFGGPASPTGLPSYTLNRVRIGFVNGAGWNMSSGGGSHANGPNAKLSASNLLIEAPGFVEEYPIVDAFPAIIGFSQSTQSNNADGISTQAGASFDFDCDYCIVRFGTEDDFDLGHLETNTGQNTVNLTHAIAYGSMGGTFKWGHAATTINVNDTMLAANCYRMHYAMTGAPSTYNKYLVDWCRGNNQISGYLRTMSNLNFKHNTFFSAINTGFDIECDDPASPGDCTGSQVHLTNNVIVGISDQNCIADGIGTCDYGGNGKPGAFFTVGTGVSITHTYNNWYNYRNLTLGTGEVLSDPLITTSIPFAAFSAESTLDSFDFSLTSGSPAKVAGVAGSPSADLFGNAFASPPSMGAVEFGSTPPIAPTPTFSPVAGAYAFPFNMTISDAVGGLTICQNTTGSPQTNSGSGCTVGTLYTAPIAINSAQTRYAVAGNVDYLDSPVGSVAYTQAQTATPTCTPPQGTFTSAQMVSCSSVSSSSTTYCTIDGTTPTTSSPVCTTISVSSTLTLKAISASTGRTNSAVLPQSYTINIPVNPSIIVTGTVTFSGTGTAQ